MVPKAISRLDQLMSQNDNLAVAEKAVSKVLDSEHVLEPAPQRVVHELEMKSVEELLQIVADTKGLPSVSLQAEIVDAEVVEDK